jgi:hypothetical protein
VEICRGKWEDAKMNLPQLPFCCRIFNAGLAEISLL